MKKQEREVLEVKIECLIKERLKLFKEQESNPYNTSDFFKVNGQITANTKKIKKVRKELNHGK